MKIQFFSDIHLEFGDFPFPNAGADVIIAAGDIGVGVQGIRWLRQAPCPVIYVPGNHEYYGGDLLGTFEQIGIAAQASPVHFLDNEALEIDGVRFLGTTLWTDFGGEDPGQMAVAQSKLNDFGQIKLQSRRLTPADLVEANWQARHWLQMELARPFTGKTVVVTHHAPMHGSWYNDRASDYRSAYCNEMTDLLRSNAIDLWVHGHVHHSSDYQVENVRIVCNPRGYNGHQVIPGFNPQRIVEI